MYPFEKYVNIKDNYCICYLGNSDEYLVQLKLFKPKIEYKYPGIKLIFCCKKGKERFLQGENYVHVTDLKSCIRFLQIYEISYSGDKQHPVEKFLVESKIDDWTICNKSEINTKKAAIITQGNYPTKSLTDKNIQELVTYIKNKYNITEIIIDPIPESSFGLVAGVESPQLFTAASYGVKTILVKTGIGDNLYKKMFPKGEIISF